MATSKIEVSLNEKPGAQGFQGWSPVLSATANGTNIVLKVTDWIGGFGVKPTINLYVTAGGYTADINLATNIRGSGAVEPGDNVIAVVGGVNVAKNHSCYLSPLGAGQSLYSFPAISAANGFEIQVISFNDASWGYVQTPGTKHYRATSRSVGTSNEQITFELFATTNIGSPSMNYYLAKGVYRIKCFNDGTWTHVYIF